MKQNITAKSDAARLLMLLVMSLLFVSTLFPSSVYAAEYEKNRSALESTYNAGCSSWVDAIVENCTRVN